MEKRHKCSICGSVRFEKFMTKIMIGSIRKIVAKTRYGNECWFCVDNLDCEQGVKEFWTY